MKMWRYVYMKRSFFELKLCYGKIYNVTQIEQREIIYVKRLETPAKMQYIDAMIIVC